METDIPKNNLVILESWLKNPAEGGLDRLSLLDVLKSCGANFEVLQNPETASSLIKWTNKGNAKAMRAIWGEKYGEYKKMVGVWMEAYEGRMGFKYGVKDKKGKRHPESGPLRLFCLLTRLAAGLPGDVDFSDARFEEEISVRVSNAELKEIGLSDQAKKLVRPDTNEEYMPSSIPPNFLTEFTGILRSLCTR